MTKATVQIDRMVSIFDDSDVRKRINRRQASDPVKAFGLRKTAELSHRPTRWEVPVNVKREDRPLNG